MPCRRIWQLAADIPHSDPDDEFEHDDEPPPPSGWCKCLRKSGDEASSACKHGNAFIWVPVGAVAGAGVLYS